MPSARLEAEDLTEPPFFIFNGRLPGTRSRSIGFIPPPPPPPPLLAEL
jgi:hypothetical protein